MTTELALDIRSSSSPLARLETTRQLLAEVRNLDDARAIHDVAEAARVYARQARLGLEAQNDAAEIKLRAERRLGELLAEQDKHRGGNVNSVPACDRLDQTGQVAGPGHFQEPVVTVAGDRRGAGAGLRSAPRRGARARSPRWHDRADVGWRHPARPSVPTPGAPVLPVTVAGQLDSDDRFEVADAGALPWPDGSVDLSVTSPPYALGLSYQGGDPPDYVDWLHTARLAERTAARRTP